MGGRDKKDPGNRGLLYGDLHRPGNKAAQHREADYLNNSGAPPGLQEAFQSEPVTSGLLNRGNKSDVEPMGAVKVYRSGAPDPYIKSSRPTT